MASMLDETIAPVCFDAESNLFAPEEENYHDDNGIVEDLPLLPNTKTILISPNDEEYDMLIRQLQQRIQEGNGETLYEIGVGDGETNGLNKEDLDASVATLESLSQTCAAELLLLREKTGPAGTVVEYLLRKKVEDEDFIEVRVAVVGNVDAGKSTLLGVLTHGELDNGRGFARQKLFRHKHEMESGRTSSVGNDILGFDSHGNVVNKSEIHGSNVDWQRICRESSKVITFIDLAGHEKYLKTTIFGMTGHAPDFAMLMIGSNAGIIGMTKEHLGLALALNVPVFVVITKIDMCPTNVLQETLNLLTRVLKSPGCRKIPMMIQNKDDVVVSASNFVSERYIYDLPNCVENSKQISKSCTTGLRVCPIFQVSNVTGENLDLLKMFLNLLSSGNIYSETDPAEFQVDETYSVPGVGTVISGTCLQGIIHLNDVLLLGPDSLGQFAPVAIKGIHRKRMPVREVRAGQTGSFALKKIKRNQIRKGMFLVDERLKPTACWEFEGEILVLHHPTTISPKYQAMVHCGSIRQTATILTMDKEHLRTGDKALVHFQFIKQPEFLKPGTRMVFREGRTKAVGTIVNTSPRPPQKPTSKLKARVHHNKHRYNKKKNRTPAPNEQKADS